MTICWSRQVFKDFDDGQDTIILKHKQLGGEDLPDERQQDSVLHSHLSRNIEAWLSLAERFIVLLRQLSYAIRKEMASMYGKVLL